MAFETVQIRSLRNGASQVDGYREDLVAGEVITLSLTSTVGVSSHRWRLVGRPEFAAAGGGGSAPWQLSTSPTATFTVDADSGDVANDGPYLVECLINEGTPTATRKRTIIVRTTGLTIDAPSAGTRNLRKFAVGESTEDTSISGVTGATMLQLNRWLQLMRGLGGGTAPSWDQFLRRDTGAAWASAPTGADDHTSATPLAGTPVNPVAFNGANHSSSAFSNTGGSGPGTAFLGGTLNAFSHALPQVLPKGIIRRFPFGNQSGVGVTPVGTRVRVGIYANLGGAGGNNIYPGARLYDSGDVDPTAGPGVYNTAAINVPVEAGLYWFALQVNATGINANFRIGTILMSAMRPVGGMTIRWGNGELTYNRSLIAAWRHALVFGAFPDPWPTATPIKIGIPDSPGSAQQPLLHYGFDPEA